MSYHFSRLIKCMDCGQNYRGKKDRGVSIYICSGYHNKKSNCKRFPLKESELIDTICQHLYKINGITELKREIGEYIKRIYVYTSEKKYIIKYIDGTESIISNNYIKF